MKSSVTLSLVLIASLSAVAQAQSVCSRAPVVMPIEYVTASSPITDGRVVRTYYSPQTRAPVTTVLSTNSSVPQVVYQPASPTYAAPPSGSTPYYSPPPAASVAPSAIAPTLISQPYAGTSCQPCTPAYGNVSYLPMTGGGCGNGGYATSYAPPNAYQSYSPLIGGRSSNVYVGRGILGQPKAYVDGQPLRNAFRFVLP